MIEVISDKLLDRALKHLSKDRILAEVILTHPRCTIRPHKNYYRELVESIIGQQLSVKAAASINRRFVELFDGPLDNGFPDAKSILNHPVEYLREAGLSGAKAQYVQDLARHVLDGTLDFSELDSMTNQEIITSLTRVKGIGEWTAHMFLMFCMARPDILPVGDLGIKNGIRKLYGLDHLPQPDEVRKVALENDWAPYESIASWYIWASLDNKPNS